MSNTSVTGMLNKLDELIEEINVESVPPDPDLDPSDIFQESASESNEQLIIKTEEFLISLQEVSFPGEIIQYSRISAKMFEKKKNFDAVENISETISKTVIENFQSMLQANETLNKRFYKLIDHIQLATFQISEITDHYREESETLRRDLTESKDELEAIKSEFETLTRETKEVSRTLNTEVSKLNVQFVTILGIFTAVVTSVFGGLQIISVAFTNIHLVPMWKVILIGSLSAIAVLCMLFLLTKWVSTIINITFERTHEKSLLDMLTNNGAFTTGLFIFSYMVCVAVVFSSNQVRGKFRDIINLWSSYPILIVLAIPLLIGILVFIKVIDMRKYKSNGQS